MWKTTTTTTSSSSSTTTTSISGESEPTDSPTLVDRHAYAAFGEHVKRVEQEYRNSSSLEEMSNAYKELFDVNNKLEDVKKECIEYIKIQSHLLQKIDQHENDFFHKIFTPNRQHKLNVLKARLVEKLTEAYEFEEEREMLQVESIRLSLQCMSESPEGDPLCETNSKMKDDRRTSFELALQGVPKSSQIVRLESQLSAYNAERAASKAIRIQTEELSSAYRQTIQLLRMALTSMLSCNYRHSVAEFVQGPMPLAIEASRLLGVASMMIQPEAKRRYPKYAPVLSNIKVPTFRNFTKFRESPLSLNVSLDTPVALDRLKENEAIVIKLQKMAVFCLKTVETWNAAVAQDCVHAETHCNRIESHLVDAQRRLMENIS